MEKKIEKEQELVLLPYNGSNGIMIYCSNPDCYCEFEETSNGYYSPIKYESEQYNRLCPTCLKYQL
jgi:hypothetical protein